MRDSPRSREGGHLVEDFIISVHFCGATLGPERIGLKKIPIQSHTTIYRRALTHRHPPSPTRTLRRNTYKVSFSFGVSLSTSSASMRICGSIR